MGVVGSKEKCNKCPVIEGKPPYTSIINRFLAISENPANMEKKTT